jgi:hypothetical protein
MAAAAEVEEIPESVLPYPKLHEDAPFVVLSDWYCDVYPQTNS